MRLLHDGNLYRNRATDPTELEGYRLETTGKQAGLLFIQIFKPCKYRKDIVCSTCPSGVKATRPTCTKKKITLQLKCVGCTERDW